MHNRRYLIISSLHCLALAACDASSPESVSSNEDSAVEPVDGLRAEADHHDDDGDEAQCIGIAVQPRYSVWLEPHDLTTGLSARPEQALRVHVRGDEISDEDLDNVMRSVRLVEYPSGSVVRAHPTVTFRPALGSGDEAFVDVVPEAPLSERWYALEYDAPRALGQGGERFTHRFRVGSFPLVRTFSMRPGDEETGISVELSEPVSDMRSATDLVTVAYDGAVVSCRPGSGPALATEGGERRVTVICPLAHPDTSVTLEMRGDIVGRSGTALVNPFGDRPERMTFRQSDLARPTVRKEVFGAD